MPQPDAAREDVLAAIFEFDNLGRDGFLAKYAAYGFAEARSYFVHHGGQFYDPKVLLAAAHGHRHGEPLRSTDFSGGDAAAAASLRRLGFVVTKPNPDWTEDEIILACDLLARNGWHYLAASRTEVIELSELLQRYFRHPIELRGPKFRNPNGPVQVDVPHAGLWPAGDPQVSAPTRHRPRAPHAGDDVAEADDLGGVLGVDDLCAAGHGEHEVGQERPEGQIAGVGGRVHDRALWRADEVVVGDRAPVGVELLARLEDDGAQPAFGVGQLSPIADRRSPATKARSSGSRCSQSWRRSQPEPAVDKQHREERQRRCCLVLLGRSGPLVGSAVRLGWH